MQPTPWAGSCGLRPLPSWKPQGGEGRGGEKRRREERSRHGALESSQGCQMPDAGHLLLYLGNRQLLGLSVATMVTLTYFGAHFAVIRRASLEKNPYQAVHQWAFSAGLSLVGLLTLGAVLSAAATVREAQGLMAGDRKRVTSWSSCGANQRWVGPWGAEKDSAAPALARIPAPGHRSVGRDNPSLCYLASGPGGRPQWGDDKGFLCFSLAFCAQVQVVFWRLRSPTQDATHPSVLNADLPGGGAGLADPGQGPKASLWKGQQLGEEGGLPGPAENESSVEDAMLDTYDLVYEQAMKGTSHVRRQELAAIQDMFLCCGKRSPFSRLGSTEADLCQGQEVAREDCLQGIRSFLRIHQQVASSLTSIGLALTVSALLLSSFLWFAIRSGCSLDRKGKYILAPRACGRQPQEPSLFRRSQDGPTHCLHSEADAIGPRRYSGSLRWLQDNDAAPGPLSRHLPAHRALQGRSPGGLSGCPVRGLSG
ncbi:tetraspanin-32 isoform X1 [Piliocolobus tephrosceles]|uniref:tetraspanin-32 isoform X1 n=2 Tax=Piliocolobus tephrosceles TaxID=591936 RepID=UPI000C2A21AE|nr:tetraspanin-32 isoform X1 [Piliocolobus tephrosceles]